MRYQVGQSSEAAWRRQQYFKPPEREPSPTSGMNWENTMYAREVMAAHEELDPDERQGLEIMHAITHVMHENPFAWIVRALMTNPGHIAYSFD